MPFLHLGDIFLALPLSAAVDWTNWPGTQIELRNKTMSRRLMEHMEPESRRDMGQKHMLRITENSKRPIPVHQTLQKQEN